VNSRDFCLIENMRKVFLVVACLAAALLCAADKKAFTPLDMVEMVRINSLSAQPNFKGFVYSSSQWLDSTNKKDNYVYYFNYSNPSAYETTFVVPEGCDGTEFSPVLLADGSIFFLSSCSGSVQLYYAEPLTFAVHQLTDFPIDIDTFKVGGSTLVFSAMVYPGTTMSGTAKIDKERAGRWDTTQEWKKGFVRRWDAFWDGKYSHVFAVNLDFKDGVYSIDSSKVVDVMGAFDGDCPSRPFGGDDEYSVSADGKLVAFTTQLGRNMPYSTDLNVYLYDRETGMRECITCDNPATDTSPIFHPDGQHLVYLAMKEPGYESDTLNVMMYDLLNKKVTPFNPNNDISWGPVQFSVDGARMFSSTLDINGSQFFELKPNGVSKVFDAQNGTFNALAWAKCPDNDNLSCPLFLLHKFDLPAEIFILDSKKNLIQLTKENKVALDGISFTEATLYTYKGANNDEVYGWLHKPYGFEEGKKYPLVMYIHGGPEDCWSNEFHYRWNPQLIAARGYAVFEPNLHGSHCASQGSAFTRSIRGNWGGWPYQDVLKAMEFLRNFTWIDVDNAAAMGASYGGFMMNWLNSQTDAFRCIICHDGLFDTIAMYYETDEVYFMTNEFNGTPTDPASTFVKYSPSTYAANMKTPELIFHGGMDFRISEVQAFGVFNNLQRLGVDSKLVRFPEENHWVVNPSNSLYWHSEVFAWLENYLDKH